VEIAHQEVDEAYSGLLAHDFDVILGEEYPGRSAGVRPGTHQETLHRDPMLLATPRDGVLADLPTRLPELADAPWALEPLDSLTGQWQRQVITAAGFEPQISFETPDPLLQAHLVSSGHAVALLPGLIPAAYLKAVRLTELPGRPHRTLHTAVREGRAGHPAIVAFRRALAAAATHAA
jgi:DNA-binding transcriptional LysR family regulator